MIAVTIAIIGIIVVTNYQTGDGWSIHTSRKVEEQFATMEPVKIDSLKRYTDYVKGVTVIKSAKYKSCFIVELDPAWDPQEDDLLDLMDQVHPMEVKDTEKFQSMVGDIITKMCSEMETFLLVDIAPPTLPPEAVVSGVTNENSMYSENKDVTKENNIINKHPEYLYRQRISATDNPNTEEYEENKHSTEVHTSSFNNKPITKSIDGNPGNDLQEPPTIANTGVELLEPPTIRSPIDLGMQKPVVNPWRENRQYSSKYLPEPPTIRPFDNGMMEPPLMNQWNKENTEGTNKYLQEPPTIRPIENVINDKSSIKELIGGNKEMEKVPKALPLQLPLADLPEFTDMNEFNKERELSDYKLIESPEPAKEPPEEPKSNIDP